VNLSAEEKVRALRELTKGAEDCFAAYAITERVGMERWRPVYSGLSDQTILLHLSGQMEIGTYPLIPDIEWPRCYWICADFDGKDAPNDDSPDPRGKKDWKKDVQKAMEFLMDFDGCPAFVNLSRSGQGAHIRMLFRESVPGWMARRWLMFWLKEAGVLSEEENDDLDEYLFRPPSFDRLIPPQDLLSAKLTFDGNRRPGNLAGAPLNRRHALSHGGTLPLDPEQVAMGNFEPDGRHWEHVMSALEQRAWGEKELIAAIEECPEEISTKPPSYRVTQEGQIKRALPVVPGDNTELEYAQAFCEFFRLLRTPGAFTYPLWVALATQLHRFGDDGYDVWHQMSSLDARYQPKDADTKWEQTADMHPIRCDSLVQYGWRCPHLKTPRCNGAKAPTYFALHTDAEVL
jgi:hypothetical protein